MTRRRGPVARAVRFGAPAPQLRGRSPMISRIALPVAGARLPSASSMGKTRAIRGREQDHENDDAYGPWRAGAPSPCLGDVARVVAEGCLSRTPSRKKMARAKVRASLGASERGPD